MFVTGVIPASSYYGSILDYVAFKLFLENIPFSSFYSMLSSFLKIVESSFFKVAISAPEELSSLDDLSSPSNFSSSRIVFLR